LSAVTNGQKSRHVVEWRPKVITLSQLCGPTVERHPHADVVRLRPSLGTKRKLGGKRSMHSIPRVVEGRAKGIASGFKNVAVLRGNAIPQYIVVSGKRLLHGVMVRFP